LLLGEKEPKCEDVKWRMKESGDLKDFKLEQGNIAPVIWGGNLVL